MHSNSHSQLYLKFKRCFKFKMYKSRPLFCHPKSILPIVSLSQFIATPSFQVFSQNLEGVLSLLFMSNHFIKFQWFKDVSRAQFLPDNSSLPNSIKPIKPISYDAFQTRYPVFPFTSLVSIFNTIYKL